MTLQRPRPTGWITVALGLIATGPLVASEIPDLTLRYRELGGREELKFVTTSGASAKPAGLLHWNFPPTGFATVGFETAPKTYCAEPMVPVVAGTDYPYRIEEFGQPRDFNLKADEDGVKAAARRTKFVRELFGRYYPASAKDSAVQAAFQTALWELLSETDVPDGPMPFSLFAGTFKADYATEAESPEFVKTAQKYVQSLTGSDAAFHDSTPLAGLELVRLTGLPNTAGVTGQSQVALRSRAGSSNRSVAATDAATGATDGLSALSGLGRSGGGLSPQMPMGGAGGGGAIGGGGIGGGGTPVGGTSATPETTPVGPLIPFVTSSTTPSTNPQGGTPADPNDPKDPNDPNDPDPKDPNQPGTNFVPNPPPPPPPTEPNPVPAPPAVLLGAIALAAFGLRKRLARKAD